MKFITLARKVQPYCDPDTSSLQVEDEHLRVTGTLPHGCEIAPSCVEDALELRAWLDRWIEAHAAPKRP